MRIARGLAYQYATGLQLGPVLPIDVPNFNAVFRTAPNGGLLIELVAQFVQTDKETEGDPGVGRRTVARWRDGNCWR